MIVTEAKKSALKKAAGEDAIMLCAEVFVGRDAAADFMAENEKKWKGKYTPYVMFRDLDSIKIPKVETLKSKFAEKEEQYKKAQEDADVTNHKAAFITCPNCKSKINKDYIKESACPVCESDMRNPNAIKKILRKMELCEKAKRKYEVEQAKHQQDAPLKYGIIKEES